MPHGTPCELDIPEMDKMERLWPRKKGFSAKCLGGYCRVCKLLILIHHHHHHHHHHIHHHHSFFLDDNRNIEKNNSSRNHYSIQNVACFSYILLDISPDIRQAVKLAV